METVVAFLVLQVRVAGLPKAMLEGEAEKVIAGAAGRTATVADAVVAPPAPVAVKVYCVEFEGFTFTDPEAATAPIP